MSADRITTVHENGEHYSRCACGARGSVVEVWDLCQPKPTYIPGALHEPCTCPRCFTCNQLLGADGRCENLDCLNLGLHILAPD